MKPGGPVNPRRKDYAFAGLISTRMYDRDAIRKVDPAASISQVIHINDRTRRAGAPSTVRVRLHRVPLAQGPSSDSEG